jgi:pectate lyase
VYPTTADELHGYMDSSDPLIIVIKDSINLGAAMHTLRSNKTIVGSGAHAVIADGGFESGNKYSNIIIQNITFNHSPDDLVKIYGAQKFWVDHCTFSDGDSVDEETDGLFDITNAANYITISNCKFFNHSKNILIGAKDGNTADSVTRATLHHNWFKGTLQRNPCVRYASVHCYNNFYDGNTIYSVVSACDARVVLENNYFRNVVTPIHIGYDDSPAGKLDTTNNIFEGCWPVLVSNGQTGSKGLAITDFETTWSPKVDYTYTMLDPSDVPAYVMTNAGVFSSSVDVKMFQNIAPEQNPNHNPISSVTLNSFQAPGPVKAAIYNINGKLLRSVCDIKAPAVSSHEVSFTTVDLAKGTCFLVVQAGKARVSQKLIVTK